MLFAHTESGRRLRLAYCMNLHPAETLEGVIEAMRRVTVPLAKRLAHGETFGVGMYFPASLAAELAADPAKLAPLIELLVNERLDPFTYNAFPAGGFGSVGLKERVFEPTWNEAARFDFTRDVARIAAALASATGSGRDGRHVSISTHTGMHSSRVKTEADSLSCARNFVRAASFLAQLEADGAPRMVLALEAEPRANCNDTRELLAFMQSVRALVPEAREVLERHLGVCLDACHAAVEFEASDRAIERATEAGPLGKLQFSSALALPHPASDEAGRAALLSMSEPAYLHQVTGRVAGCGPQAMLRAHDLPEFQAELELADSLWNTCSEWRCHFHVPVDLDQPLEGNSAGRLGTTRVIADELLGLLSSQPERWGTEELHVEIETYTWDLLAGPTRGEGNLIDGLTREYEHVLARLDEFGWSPVRSH